MPGMHLRFYQIEECVKLLLPKLHQCFMKHGINSSSMYGATQWFITIFLAAEMDFDIQIHIFDIYLYEGYKTIFRMGLGLLKYYEKELLKSSFEDIMTLFRLGPKKLEYKKYFDICFSLKLTHSHLENFEKQYYASKK